MARFSLKTILFLVLGVTLMGFSNTNAKSNQNALSQSIETYLKEATANDGFSGSVLVAHQGKVIVSSGFGYASAEFQMANQCDTRFRIGSLTKQFTSLAIMMLEEENLLKMDTPLATFIPDYPNGEKITIKHLLTHTSGIPDHTSLPGFQEARRVYPTSLLETIDSFKTLDLEFQPGSKFEYSNSGYILLGYIIETITGKPYADLIQTRIFDLIDMGDSGFIDRDTIISNMASGYSKKNELPCKAPYRDISNAHASGALYSSVEDLYKWDRALYQSQLLEQSQIQKMFIPYRSHYALGWGVIELFGHQMVGHNGDTEGFSSNISRFPQEDVCIVLLSNQDKTNVGKMAYDIAGLIFNPASTTDQQETVSSSKTVVSQYCGEYEMNPQFIFYVTEEDGKIYCMATGQSKLEMHPEKTDWFFFKEVEAKIQFVKDTAGNVIHLVLYQSGQEVKAKKIK